jgi:hypothetical protein
MSFVSFSGTHGSLESQEGGTQSVAHTARTDMFLFGAFTESEGADSSSVQSLLDAKVQEQMVKILRAVAWENIRSPFEDALSEGPVSRYEPICLRKRYWDGREYMKHLRTQSAQIKDEIEASSGTPNSALLAVIQTSKELETMFTMPTYSHEQYAAARGAYEKAYRTWKVIHDI